MHQLVWVQTENHYYSFHCEKGDKVTTIFHDHNQRLQLSHLSSSVLPFLFAFHRSSTRQSLSLLFTPHPPLLSPSMCLRRSPNLSLNLTSLSVSKPSRPAWMERRRQTQMETGALQAFISVLVFSPDDARFILFLPHGPKCLFLASCHKHVMESCHLLLLSAVFTSQSRHLGLLLVTKTPLKVCRHIKGGIVAEHKLWNHSPNTVNFKGHSFFPPRDSSFLFFFFPFSWTLWEDLCTYEQMQNCLSVRALSPKARAVFPHCGHAEQHATSVNMSVKQTVPSSGGEILKKKLLIWLLF